MNRRFFLQGLLGSAFARSIPSLPTLAAARAAARISEQVRVSSALPGHAIIGAQHLLDAGTPLPISVSVQHIREDIYECNLSCKTGSGVQLAVQSPMGICVADKTNAFRILAETPDELVFRILALGPETEAKIWLRIPS